MPPHTLKVASVQNRATGDLQTSLADALALVHEAAAAGAELICLPEFFACLAKDDQGLTVGAHTEADHPAFAALRQAAGEHGRWLLLGSLAVRDAHGALRNRSILLDDRGRPVARYDKIHMFDVDLPGGESYRESDLFEPGTAAVVATTPWGGIGLTVCYDLRFASLYRRLAQAGAAIITIPAAFTRTTGEAHWHVLVRARAIETGAFVVAPCQWGCHGQAATFGHSLIVDPWGKVLADGGTGRGIVLAELDLRQVETARRMIPALTHDREFTLDHPLRTGDDPASSTA